MSQAHSERVLVVPTEIFHRLGHFQGFRSQAEGVAQYLEELLDPRHISYRPRSEMEIDPSFKQLIPYCIFRYRDPQSGPLIFQYTRGKGQGDDESAGWNRPGRIGHRSGHSGEVCLRPGGRPIARVGCNGSHLIEE